MQSKAQKKSQRKKKQTNKSNNVPEGESSTARLRFILHKKKKNHFLVQKKPLPSTSHQSWAGCYIPSESFLWHFLLKLYEGLLEGERCWDGFLTQCKVRSRKMVRCLCSSKTTPKRSETATADITDTWLSSSYHGTKRSEESPQVKAIPPPIFSRFFQEIMEK